MIGSSASTRSGACAARGRRARPSAPSACRAPWCRRPSAAPAPACSRPRRSARRRPGSPGPRCARCRCARQQRREASTAVLVEEGAGQRLAHRVGDEQRQQRAAADHRGGDEQVALEAAAAARGRRPPASAAPPAPRRRPQPMPNWLAPVRRSRVEPRSSSPRRRSGSPRQRQADDAERAAGQQPARPARGRRACSAPTARRARPASADAAASARPCSSACISAVGAVVPAEHLRHAAAYQAECRPGAHTRAARTIGRPGPSAEPGRAIARVAGVDAARAPQRGSELTSFSQRAIRRRRSALAPYLA